MTKDKKYIFIGTKNGYIIIFKFENDKYILKEI